MTYNTDPRGTATQDDDDDGGDGAPNGGGGDGGWQPLGWWLKVSELRGRLVRRSRTTGRSTLSATGAGVRERRTTTADGEIAAATDAGPRCGARHHADDNGGAAAAGPAVPLLAGGADADGWQPPPPMLSSSPPRGSTPSPGLTRRCKGCSLSRPRAPPSAVVRSRPAPAAPPPFENARRRARRRAAAHSRRRTETLLDDSALLDPSAENRAAPIGPIAPGRGARRGGGAAIVITS